MSSKIFITFLLLFFFVIICNKTCEEVEAQNRNDCFSRSNSSYYCCYKSSNSKVSCETVPKSNLTQNYFLDCGVSEDNYEEYEFGEYHPKQEFKDIGLQTCGKMNPKKKQDCTDFSEINNSCCYFTNKEGQKACFSIGRRADKKRNKGNYEDDISYECWSFNLIFYFCSIFLIFLQL